MRKTSNETIEKAYDLYKSGKSYAEIERIIGVKADTISKHLRSIYGIQKINFSKKIDQTVFEKLWNEGKSDKEIADYFDVTELTVKTFRTKGKNAGKYNVIRYFSQTEQKLSYLQKQFVLGSLLGDLNLSKPTNNRHVNSRLAIVQCEAQKDLFMKKVEILDKFMGSWRLNISKPDKRTGNIYSQYRGNSKTHKVFTDIYNVLYINEIKKITKEYLDMIDSPIALAYWFMDDGDKTGVLATNSFTWKEQMDLLEWMKDKWNIACSLNKNKDTYVLRILQENRLDFEKLIFPFIIPSMFYKLKYLDQLI